MQSKFVCAECGHDVFEDKGIIYFARMKWIGLKCEKCGNHILLEENEYDYEQISSNSNKLLISFDKK